MSTAGVDLMEQPLIKRYDSTGDTATTKETTASDEYTVEQVIESMKWGRFHVFIIMLIGIFTATDCMEIMLLTVLFPVVQCEWQLSALEVSLLSVAVFTGMLVGSTLWGTLADKFGRKPVIYIATALVAYHGFLGSFSPNIYWLYILRFIVGAGIAAVTQTEVVLIEFVATRYRGTTIIVLRAFFAIGTLLEILLAWAVIPTLGWRYLMAFTAIPVTLFLLSWPIVPESVRFLLISGQNEKAMTTLRKAARINRSELPPGTLRPVVIGERGRLADLFGPEYCRTTVQVLYIYATVIALYYGVSLATTELVSMNYCGTPNTTSSSPSSSKECGCSSLSGSDYGHIALTATAEILVLPIAIGLAEFLGRRRALALCQVVVAASFLLLFTCVGSTWGVVVLLFIARGFATSSSAIVHLYVPEVFPTQIRSIGASSGYFAGRIGAMMTPLISQMLLRSSVHVALAVYAVMCLVCCIVALLLPIETKGKQIQ